MGGRGLCGGQRHNTLETYDGIVSFMAMEEPHSGLYEAIQSERMLLNAGPRG